MGWDGVPFGRLSERRAEARSAGSDPADFDASAAVEDILESEMENHHEDARDSVVDEDALVEAARRWGEGETPDADFAAFLDGWNARQNLVSHRPDETVAVPVAPGATREEALAHAQAAVSRAEAALAAALDSWEPPEPAPEASPAASPAGSTDVAPASGFGAAA